MVANFRVRRRLTGSRDACVASRWMLVADDNYAMVYLTPPVGNTPSLLQHRLYTQSSNTRHAKSYKSMPLSGLWLDMPGNGAINRLHIKFGSDFMASLSYTSGTGFVWHQILAWIRTLLYSRLETSMQVPELMTCDWSPVIAYFLISCYVVSSK